MLFAALGLALGSHVVTRNQLPPSKGQTLAAAVTGGVTGALLSVIGFELGVTLAHLFGLKRVEGVEWAELFLPPWICWSGGFAILSRYLAWHLLGDHIVLASAAGAVGALVGDALVTLLLIRPFATGPPLQAPPVVTAALGALVAAGLAWAERKVPHKNADADNAPLANDTKRQ
jgi:uncharacterized membrane protein YeaQ/YmgE (transglycosylase-associated protein family)